MTGYSLTLVHLMLSSDKGPQSDSEGFLPWDRRELGR